MAIASPGEGELVRVLRELVRQVVVEELDKRQLRASESEEEREAAPERPEERLAPPEPLKGVRPYDLAAFAEHALRDGPLHVSVLARRCYALGFKHKWEPKHPNQLENSSLNQLVDRLPHKFERVAPGVLKLRT